MENKKGQPTTEAIFRGIQSGKVLELFDKLQYQIAIHGDLTYSDPWGEVHRFRDQFESAKHDSDSPTAIGRYPFADVWDMFCVQKNVPLGEEWLKGIQEYERRV